MNSKTFLSAFSHHSDGLQAAQEVCSELVQKLAGKSCDLALVFLSEHYENQSGQTLLSFLEEELHPGVILACNASGIIGDDRELEMQPGISVMAMHLPGVRLVPFSLAATDIEYLKNGTDLLQFLDLYPTDKPHFICLAEPTGCNVSRLLELFNEGYPGAPIIGGLSSATVVGAPGWVFLNGEFQDKGAAGVALLGDISFDICVSQGCRPIGVPLVVTKANENILLELGGKPPLDAFRDVYKTLNSQDQMLAQYALFVGLVIDETKPHYEQGDFLVRNIVGVDQDSGALSVGAILRPGQTLQFQLRDASTSSEELSTMLKHMPSLTRDQSAGALLISCCGRGRGLYGEEDHDIRLIQRYCGPLPVAGFFANGEFGPVQGKNFTHGYTSSLAIIH